MRVWLLIAGLTACSFNPTVEDTSLIGCDQDADCPRAAACVGNICVSNPLTIASMTATPASVEVGERCTFEAHAFHSLGPDRLRFRWTQVLGPRVPLTINGNRVELTTNDSHVGSYSLEVTVDNGVDPPQRGRASCVALRTDDAAFAVRGHNGDCSREDPCDALDTAAATGARFIYLGVDEGTTDVVTFGEPITSTYDDREVHGGFVYPGWRRDPTVRTSLRGATTTLAITCDRCVVSGIYHLRLFDEGFSEYHAITAYGEQVTLREVDVEMGGGGGSLEAIGIDVHTNYTGVSIEGAYVHISPIGLAGAYAKGIEQPGAGVTIRDALIDLRGATADVHIGVELSALESHESRPILDRLTVYTGTPTDLAIGLDLDCTAPRVTNSIVIADTITGDSQALRLDGAGGCSSGIVIHSSLFVAGSGPRSTAVRVVDTLRALTLTNSILDAGNGFERRVFDIAGGSLDSNAWSYDLNGSVLVLEGGEQSRDAWGEYDGDTTGINGLETLFSCPACLETADTAAHVDRAGGDFHLTAGSSCCIDTGEPIGDEGPHLDYDGVPRPLEGPAVGPYQLVR